MNGIISIKGKEIEYDKDMTLIQFQRLIYDKSKMIILRINRGEKKLKRDEKVGDLNDCTIIYDFHSYRIGRIKDGVEYLKCNYCNSPFKLTSFTCSHKGKCRNEYSKYDNILNRQERVKVIREKKLEKLLLKKHHREEIHYKNEKDSLIESNHSNDNISICNDESKNQTILQNSVNCDSINNEQDLAKETAEMINTIIENIKRKKIEKLRQKAREKLKTMEEKQRKKAVEMLCSTIDNIRRNKIELLCKFVIEQLKRDKHIN